MKKLVSLLLAAVMSAPTPADVRICQNVDMGTS